MLSGAKARKTCRSRQELSNEYLLSEFGVDRAENGPLKVCQKTRDSTDAALDRGRAASVLMPAKPVVAV